VRKRKRERKEKEKEHKYEGDGGEGGREKHSVITFILFCKAHRQEKEGAHAPV